MNLDMCQVMVVCQKQLNVVGVVKITPNDGAMTSKGLRASYLSKYTEADASYNLELNTTTFIGYSLC